MNNWTPIRTGHNEGRFETIDPGIIERHQECQPRVDGTDQKVVADYAMDMREYDEIYKEQGIQGCNKFLHIQCVKTEDEKYILFDGFHRHDAILQVGYKTIDIWIYDGTFQDAVLLSKGQNANNGIRRSNADKAFVVKSCLMDDELKQWSNEQIAKWCGVTAKTVGNHEERLCNLQSEQGKTYERPKVRYYLKSDGTIAEQDTSEIGKRNGGSQPKPPAQSEFDTEKAEALVKFRTQKRALCDRIRETPLSDTLDSVLVAAHVAYELSEALAAVGEVNEALSTDEINSLTGKYFLMVQDFDKPIADWVAALYQELEPATNGADQNGADIAQVELNNARKSLYEASVSLKQAFLATEFDCFYPEFLTHVSVALGCEELYLKVVCDTNEFCDTADDYASWRDIQRLSLKELCTWQELLVSAKSDIEQGAEWVAALKSEESDAEESEVDEKDEVDHESSQQAHVDRLNALPGEIKDAIPQWQLEVGIEEQITLKLLLNARSIKRHRRERGTDPFFKEEMEDLLELMKESPRVMEMPVRELLGIWTETHEKARTALKKLWSNAGGVDGILQHTSEAELAKAAVEAHNFDSSVIDYLLQEDFAILKGCTEEEAQVWVQRCDTITQDIINKAGWVLALKTEQDASVESEASGTPRTVAELLGKNSELWEIRIEWRVEVNENAPNWEGITFMDKSDDGRIRSFSMLPDRLIAELLAIAMPEHEKNAALGWEAMYQPELRESFNKAFKAWGKRHHSELSDLSVEKLTGQHVCKAYQLKAQNRKTNVIVPNDYRNTLNFMESDDVKLIEGLRELYPSI